jgi:hypothetical protein
VGRRPDVRAVGARKPFVPHDVQSQADEMI